MDIKFAPMLAGKVKDTAKLIYPVIVSPKLDGIRAINPNGDALLSRNLKAIPNHSVQERFGHLSTRYFDGELICGDPRSKTCYRDTNSAVMSKEGTPDVKYYVFDHFQFWGEAFGDRLGKLPARLPEGVVVVEQHLVYSEEELLRREQEWLDQGYEGLMVRSVTSPYKFGRSTDREGFLLKLKRFSDAEYKIVGFEERMHNGNEATTDELGRTKRSSHQEGKSGRNDLGALVLEMDDGQTFNCGSGFDDPLRVEIWENRASYLGKFAKVKSFLIGVKDKPRFPVFLGFRAEGDMS